MGDQLVGETGWRCVHHPGVFGILVIVTILVIIAYKLSDWSSVETFAPNRWPIMIIGGLVMLYFFFVTIPAQPFAALIFSVLLGLVHLGLRWNRPSETDGSIFDSFNSVIRSLEICLPVSIPFCAVAVYALAMYLDLQWRTNWLLYLITTPTGFILFGLSLIRTWQARKMTNLSNCNFQRMEAFLQFLFSLFRANAQRQGHFGTQQA